MHRYVPNSRPILPPEISWNEVSDLDVILEEIRAFLEKYQPQQLDPNLQDSEGGEESDYNFESKPQQQQESKENPDQARNEAKFQIEQNQKQQFSHIPVFSESTKFINGESRNIHHSPQNRSINSDHDTSAGDEERAQKNAISDIAASISSSSVTITAAIEHEQNKSSGNIEVSASGKRKEELATPLGQNGNEDGGASAEGTEAMTNTDHGHGGMPHDSPQPRDQEGNGITRVMNDEHRRELHNQERDSFGGGGGSNHHRRALPLVARPPVLEAAEFPWMRESESQSEPIAGDAEASRFAGGELKKMKVVAPIPDSEDGKRGRGSCGVGLGYDLLGLTQNLETQIKKKDVGPFNLGPMSKLAGFFGQLHFSALIFYFVDGLRFYL